MSRRTKNNILQGSNFYRCTPLTILFLKHSQEPIEIFQRFFVFRGQKGKILTIPASSLSRHCFEWVKEEGGGIAEEAKSLGGPSILSGLPGGVWRGGAKRDRMSVMAHSRE